jgi:hypothetical protein
MALAPTSVAYTRKDFSGFWNFFPEEDRALATAADEA